MATNYPSQITVEDCDAVIEMKDFDDHADGIEGHETRWYQRAWEACKAFLSSREGRMLKYAVVGILLGGAIVCVVALSVALPGMILAGILGACATHSIYGSTLLGAATGGLFGAWVGAKSYDKEQERIMNGVAQKRAEIESNFKKQLEENRQRMNSVLLQREGAFETELQKVQNAHEEQLQKLKDVVHQNEQKTNEQLIRLQSLINQRDGTINQFSDLAECLFCALCSKAQRNVRFEPCGHLISCVNCARRCTRCPKCNSAIDVFQKTMLN